LRLLADNCYNSRDMKVLLINPDSSFERVSTAPPHIPYGILYIAAVLEGDGHQVRVIDRNLREEWTDAAFDDEVLKFAPQTAGLSVMTGQVIEDAVKISRRLKELRPDLPVVWGGVHGTILPEQTAAAEFVDVVVRNEGELTARELFPALAAGNPLDRIKGISFKGDRAIINTPPREFLTDLEALPDPAWHLIPVEKYGDLYHTLNTSRGCPFRCSFCYNQVFSKKRRAELGPRRIMTQLRLLVEHYGARHFKFMEDNFTMNRERLAEFCRLKIAEGPPVTWECESRVAWLDLDMYRLMRRAGCTKIGFGVESGSPRILKLLKKDISPAQVEETFRLCFAAKIRADVFIMSGVPTETMDDFEQTVRLLRRIPFWGLCFMVYKPYPGTELFDYCVEQGLFSPPGHLEDWARFGDVFGTSHTVGQVPGEVLERFMFVDGLRLESINQLRFKLLKEPGHSIAQALNPLRLARFLAAKIRLFLGRPYLARDRQ